MSSEIRYTYKVLSVDEPHRVMMLEYSAVGLGPTQVSARLPYEGESLADVAAEFSPAPWWRAQTTPVAPPAEDATGKLIDRNRPFFSDESRTVLTGAGGVFFGGSQ